MGKRKVSIVSILAFIIGLSGLGLGVYSIYNYLQLANQIESPKPLARAFVSSGQSVPDHTWTVVDFDVLEYDVTGDFNIVTDRFICPTSGYYLISGAVSFTSMLDGEYIIAGVYREGILEAISTVYASQTASLSTSFTDIIYLNAGDYVELRVYHNGSFDRGIYGNTEGSFTYLTITATDNLN